MVKTKDIALARRYVYYTGYTSVVAVRAVPRADPFFCVIHMKSGHADVNFTIIVDFNR